MTDALLLLQVLATQMILPRGHRVYDKKERHLLACAYDSNEEKSLSWFRSAR